MKLFYRNRLPHIAPLGAIFFVTFRLADSLPASIYKELKDELDHKMRDIEEADQKDSEIIKRREKIFEKIENLLDKKPQGNCCLINEAVAEIIKEKLHSFDDKYYSLLSYTIMPNHVHIVMDTSVQIGENDHLNHEISDSYVQLHEIMRRIKGGTSILINRYLKRQGTLWQKDSFDRFMRSEEEAIQKIIYTIMNPVNAGLVKDWKLFPNTYLRKDLYDFLPERLL